MLEIILYFVPIRHNRLRNRASGCLGAVEKIRTVAIGNAIAIQGRMAKRAVR